MYKQIMWFIHSASGRGFIFPKRYKSYGIIIPLNKEGKVGVLRGSIIKVLLTIAERVAEF
jgi:hypothetical protein